MSISIKSFMGRRPRLHARYLNDSQASIATGTYLTGGSLKAWRDTTFTAAVAKTGILGKLFLYAKGSAYERWCHWAEEVDVEMSPIAGDTTYRAYFTGTDAPRAFNNALVDIGGNDQYPEDSYLLGVPAPSSAMTATLAGTGSGPTVSRAYVVTYVSGWGEEGPPSPASNIVNWQSGNTVDLTSIPTAPAGDYNITHKNIYRVVTTNTGSAYLFVAQITVGTTSYNDSIADTALGEQLPSATWDPPPSGMKNLIALPNGVFAGSVGNTVYMSEAYLPHAWPYSKSFTSDVVALSSIGSNTIVVLTKTIPHLIHCPSPDQAYPVSMEGAPYPCVSKRSVSRSPFGVFYASTMGMIQVTLAGATNITKDLMTRDEWKGYKPETIHGVFYDDRYIGFYSRGLVGGLPDGNGFVLAPNDEISLFSDLEFYADAAHIDPTTGNLYLAVWNGTSNYVYQWHNAGSFRNFQWRSKEFLANPRVYRCAQVHVNLDQSQDEIDAYNAERDAQIAANNALMADLTTIKGPLASFYCADASVSGCAGTNFVEVLPAIQGLGAVTFVLYGDKTLIHQETVVDNTAFRIPGGKKYRNYEVELLGNAKVDSVLVAESKRTLKRLAEATV